jgi:hypothetical protein
VWFFLGPIVVLSRRWRTLSIKTASKIQSVIAQNYRDSALYRPILVMRHGRIDDRSAKVDATTIHQRFSCLAGIFRMPSRQDSTHHIFTTTLPLARPVST